MNADRDIHGASMAFQMPVVKVDGETKCRCRECDRNDIPLANMAVFSFKEWFRGFTGICKECVKKEEW